MFGIEAIQPFGVQIRSGSWDSELTEIPSDRLSSLLQKNKLALFRGFRPMDRESFLDFTRGHLGSSLGMSTLDWDFGPVNELKEQPNAKNYLFSSEKVPYHWDGAFYKVPHYLVFYCVEAPPPGAGGETLFCDTQRIWEKADDSRRKTWSQIQLSYETEKLAHYGGTFTSPLVQSYPGNGDSILRFAEEVRSSLNPVSLNIDGIPDEDKESFVNDMIERIYSPEFAYHHEWKVHDLLIADNHALLHGRAAYTKDCPRHLRRIQLI